jgi:ribonuclease HI
MAPEVKIYLEVEPKSPRCKFGSYAYVLEHRGHTLEGFGEVQDSTLHQLILTCANAAVERMVRPGDIIVYSQVKHLKFGTEYLNTWELHNWKNAKGELIANAELWQRWARNCKKHKIQVEFLDCSEYSAWMLTEMERRKNEGVVQSS